MCPWCLLKWPRHIVFLVHRPALRIPYALSGKPSRTIPCMKPGRRKGSCQSIKPLQNVQDGIGMQEPDRPWKNKDGEDRGTWWGTTRYVSLEESLIWPVKSIFSFSRLLFHDWQGKKIIVYRNQSEYNDKSSSDGRMIETLPIFWFENSIMSW